MQKLTILNAKKRASVLRMIEHQWDCSPDFSPWALLEKDGRLFLANQELFSFPAFESLHINSLGTYFGTLTPDGLRLSIEGSQIVGPLAKKNVIELSESDQKRWLSGENLDLGCKETGYVILKSSKRVHDSNGKRSKERKGDNTLFPEKVHDFLGTGKASRGIVHNYVPKERRTGT